MQERPPVSGGLSSAQALMTDATRVTNIITEQRIDKAIGAADKEGMLGHG